MSRPYLRYSAKELLEVYDSSKYEFKILEDLKFELESRKSKKSKKLLNRVIHSLTKLDTNNKNECNGIPDEKEEDWPTLLTSTQIENLKLDKDHLYVRKIQNVNLYAPNEYSFLKLINFHSEIAEKYLNSFFLIRASQFHQFFRHHCKTTYRWEIELSCVRAIVPLLIQSSRIGYMLAQSSDTENPFICYYPLKYSSFLYSLYAQSSRKLQEDGELSLTDLAHFSSTYKLPSTKWPELYLKHLYYLGLGTISDQILFAPMRL